MVPLYSRIFKKGFKLFEIFVNFARPFHSLTPLKEKHFWPHVARRNGTCRSVSVVRSSRVLVSDNLSNRHAR